MEVHVKSQEKLKTVNPGDIILSSSGVAYFIANVGQNKYQIVNLSGKSHYGNPETIEGIHNTISTDLKGYTLFSKDEYFIDLTAK